MNQNAFDQNIKEKIAKFKETIQNIFKTSIQIDKYKSISQEFKAQIEEFNSKLWKISTTPARIAIQGDIKQINYQTAFFDNAHAKDLETKFNLLTILMSDYMAKESCNFQKFQIQFDYLIYSVLLNINSFNQLVQQSQSNSINTSSQMAQFNQESQNQVLFQIQEIIQLLFHWECIVSNKISRKEGITSKSITNSTSQNLEKEESVINLEIFNYDIGINIDNVDNHGFQIELQKKSKSKSKSKSNFNLVNSSFELLLQFIRDRIVSLGLCLVYFGNTSHLLYMFQEILLSSGSIQWAKQLVRFPNDLNLENLGLFNDTLTMAYRILENGDKNNKPLGYDMQINLIEFINNIPFTKLIDFLNSNPFKDFTQFQNYVLEICRNFGDILQKLDPTIYEIKIITQKIIDFSREIATPVFKSNIFDISRKHEFVDSIFLEAIHNISQVPHLMYFLTTIPYEIISLNTSWEVINFMFQILEKESDQKIRIEKANLENPSEKIDKINQDGNFVLNCPYDIGVPIIYIFGKMAKFQNNEKLSTSLILFFWKISSSNHNNNQIYLKTLLQTTKEILQDQHQHSGFLLEQINNSLPNTVAPEVMYSFILVIPIALWSPSKKHFQIIKEWINYPFGTPHFASATQIIEKLNWEYSSDSLHIHPNFHQMILLAIEQRSLEMKKQSLQNQAHFYKWCWKIFLQLKIVKNNGERYLEPLDFSQFEKKINKNLTSISSYAILISTNFNKILQNYLKDQKRDLDTLCNKLFQPFIKEKTIHYFAKVLYLLIKETFHNISVRKNNENQETNQEENSLEYCLKLMNNVQFLYRDYFQKIISLESIPTEYIQSPSCKTEMFISDFIYTMLISSIGTNPNKSIKQKNLDEIDCSNEFNNIVLFWLSLLTSFQDWNRNSTIIYCLNNLTRLSFVFDFYQLVEMFFIHRFQDQSSNQVSQNPFGIIHCSSFIFRKNLSHKERLNLIHNLSYILFVLLMAETKQEVPNRKIIGKQILEKQPKEIAKFIKSKVISVHLNHLFWWVDFVRFHQSDHPLSPLIWQTFFALYFESLDTQSFRLMAENSKNIDSNPDSEPIQHFKQSPTKRKKFSYKIGWFGSELLMLYPDSKHHLFDELILRLEDISKNSVLESTNLQSDFGLLFSSMKYWIQKDIQNLFSQAYSKKRQFHDEYFFSKLMSLVTNYLFDKKSNFLWFDLFHKPSTIYQSSLQLEYQKIFASFFTNENDLEKTTVSNADHHAPHSLQNHHRNGLDSLAKNNENNIEDDDDDYGDENQIKNEISINGNKIPIYDRRYILSWFKMSFDKIIKFEHDIDAIDDINKDFRKYIDLLVSEATSFQNKLKYHKKMDVFFFNFISKIFKNEQEKHIFTFTFPDILEIREESLLFMFPAFKKKASMIDSLNRNRLLASKYLSQYPLISKKVSFAIFFLEKAFEILGKFMENCHQEEQKRKMQFIHIKWTNQILVQMCNNYSILFPPIYNFANKNFESIVLIFLNLYSEMNQNETKDQEMDFTLHLIFKLIFSRFKNQAYPKKLAELANLQNQLKNYLQAQFPKFYTNILEFSLKKFLEDGVEISNLWEFLLSLPIKSKLSFDQFIYTITFLNEQMASFTHILFIENDFANVEKKQFDIFQLFSVFPETILKYLIKFFNLLSSCDCISQMKSSNETNFEYQSKMEMNSKVSFRYFIFKTLYLQFLEIFHFLDHIKITNEIMKNICEQFQECVDSTNFVHDYKQFLLDFEKFPKGSISQSFSQALTKYINWSKIVVDEELIQEFVESIKPNNALITISSFYKFDWEVYLSSKSQQLSENRLKLIISILWNIFYYQSEEERMEIINFFCKNISAEKEVEESTYNSIIDFAKNLISTVNPIRTEKKENKIIVNISRKNSKIHEIIPINDIMESIKAMKSSEFKIILIVLFIKMVGNFDKTKDLKKSEIYTNFLYNMLRAAIISQENLESGKYSQDYQNTDRIHRFIKAFLMFCAQDDLKKFLSFQEQEINLNFKTISENLIIFFFSEIVVTISDINFTENSLSNVIDLLNISRTRIREILMRLFFQRMNNFVFIAEFMKNSMTKITSKKLLYLIFEIFSSQILANSTQIKANIETIQDLDFDNQHCINFGNWNLLILSFLIKERENFDIESFKTTNDNFFDLIIQASFPQYREKAILLFFYLYFYNINTILDQYENYQKINTEDFIHKITIISEVCLKYSQNEVSIPWIDKIFHETNYQIPKIFQIVFNILHTYIHNKNENQNQNENENENENENVIKQYFQEKDNSKQLIEDLEKLQNQSISNLKEFTKNILEIIKLLNQLLFIENQDYYSNFETIENFKPKFTNQK